MVKSVQERLGSQVCKRVHGGRNATVTHPRELCCAQAWLEQQTRSYTKINERFRRGCVFESRYFATCFGSHDTVVKYLDSNTVGVTA